MCRGRSSTLLNAMLNFLRRLIDEESGQDVIEYGLLTAGIGIVSIATWPLIETGIFNVYGAIDADTQAAWEIPDPGSN